MATHGGSTPSQGSGSDGREAAGSSGSAGSGSSKGGSAPIGAIRVDTGSMDSAAARMDRVADRLADLQAHVRNLGEYRPTLGGREDSTWSSFVAQGYGSGVAQTAAGIRALAESMRGFGDGLRSASSLFAEVEHEAARAGARLGQALTSTSDDGQAR